MKTKVIVVDKNDRIVTHKHKSELEFEDIMRVTGIWIENELGEILLAQRVFTKKYDPGKWGPAAAGTVDEGETYLSNITKEVDEELGISLKEKDIKHLKTYYEETTHKFFVALFYIKIDSKTKFYLQEDEVLNIQWISKDNLKEKIKNEPEYFIDGFEKIEYKAVNKFKKQK